MPSKRAIGIISKERRERKDFKHGKVQSLRQGNYLRSQPLLFPACHQPHVQTQPPEGFGNGKGSPRAEDAVHQVHQNTWQICGIRFVLFLPQESRRIQRRDFCFNVNQRAGFPRPYAVRISFNARTPAPLPCGCLNAAFPVTNTFAPARFINGRVSALIPPSTSR